MFWRSFSNTSSAKYAQLLKDKLEKHGSIVYLVNTGWVGGSPSSGANRISIKDTRNIITSILDGSIEKSNFYKEDFFGLNIPEKLNNVNESILNPSNGWNNKDMYSSVANKLAEMFKENFNQYGEEVEYLKKFGPVI